MKKVRGSACRLKLTTKDVAKLLGTTESGVRMRIFRGSLVFSGDPIEDFWMLCRMALPEVQNE